MCFNIYIYLLNIWKSFNILILVGNHDAYYKDKSDVNSLSIISGWENITVVSEPTQIECFNRKFMICPWGTAVSEMKKSDIIFGHFEIQSFKFNQHRSLPLKRREKVQKRYNTVCG